MKKNDIEKRILAESDYILQTHKTIREVASYFGVSKSTIHKDMTVKLPEISIIQADKVKEVIQFNLGERHIRGGNSTKLKYKM